MSHEPELFDTSRVRDDDAHWGALAERIAARAIRDERAGVSWVAREPAGLLVAALSLAAALAFAALPANRGSMSSGGADLEGALGPSDAVGRSIISVDRPPAIGALLLARETASAK
jgi:hypothetical protein